MGRCSGSAQAIVKTEKSDLDGYTMSAALSEAEGRAIPLSPGSRAGSLPLIAGVLALDFCNTSSGRGSEEEREHLRTPGDLLAWAGHAAIFPPDKLKHLGQQLGQAGSATQERLLDSALALRDRLYDLGRGLAAGGPPDEALLRALTAAHGDALATARLERHRGNFRLCWEPGEDPAAALLGPLTLSALTLLTDSDLRRVKQCPGLYCGWLFYDATKNGRRRWCEMSVCGNRAKQRAYRRRHGPVAHRRHNN